MPFKTSTLAMGAALCTFSPMALAQSEEMPPAYPTEAATGADALPQASPGAPTAPAAAAPTSPAEVAPPQGKIVFTTAPLPAPNGGDSSRTFHFHDGFYSRLGLHYGLTGGGLSIGDRSIDYSGSQLGLDLLIGGTPSDGLAVGGGVLIGSLLQPTMEEDGEKIGTRNTPLLLVGPFVDGFFTPSGGWHAGAHVGLAALGETSQTKGSAGFGGVVWLGYDRWVGDDWSVGGQLRFLGIAAGGNEPQDFSASAIGVGLGFSVLYH